MRRSCKHLIISLCVLLSMLLLLSFCGRFIISIIVVEQLGEYKKNEGKIICLKFPHKDNSKNTQLQFITIITL